MTQDSDGMITQRKSRRRGKRGKRRKTRRRRRRNASQRMRPSVQKHGGRTVLSARMKQQTGKAKSSALQKQEVDANARSSITSSAY